MPCVCARLPRFNKKSELNLHHIYILARTERPAGLRSPQERTRARTGQEIMASEYSFARGVSLPAHRPPLTFTSYRLRHSAARTMANPRVMAAASAVSVGAARRMPGSVRYGGAGVAALRAEEVDAVPPSVPVRVAYELQLAGHRYLDVRTEGEFGGGHPVGAVNNPYMYNTGSGMAKNSHFLEQVSAIFRRDDEIIIRCQSGKRSLMAAAELCSAGFTAVTTSPEGSRLGGRTDCRSMDGGNAVNIIICLCMLRDTTSVH
ncbi:hypothetical protein VPH35_133223 [Triticum aestivum]